jgi:prevent-host-death family protein
MKVNMHDAKTNFSKLVERALQGEEIVVARNGKALVRLVPVQENGGLRPLGLDKQTVGADFEQRSVESIEGLEWDGPLIRQS